MPVVATVENSSISDAAAALRGGCWEFPGGKVDLGEAFDYALVREVREETGLEIVLGRVAGATDSEAPDRKIAYLVLEAQFVSGEVRLSEEHDAFQWVEPQQLAEHDLPQFSEFAADYTRRRGR